MRVTTHFGANMEGTLMDEIEVRIARLPSSLGPANPECDPSDLTESHGPYTTFYEKGFLCSSDRNRGLQDCCPVIFYMFPRGYRDGFVYITYVGGFKHWVSFLDHSHRHLPVDDEGEVLDGRRLTTLQLIGPSRITPPESPLQSHARSANAIPSIREYRVAALLPAFCLRRLR